MSTTTEKTVYNPEELARENVKRLTPYVPARDKFKNFNHSPIYLDANENPFANGINRYPDPHQEKLKQTIAVRKQVTTKQLFVGNGSNEVLDLIIRTFCEPRIDSIITLPPTYGMFGVLAEINDVENRKVPLGKDFQPDTKKILKACDENTKIIFLCSPNNPTGNSIDESIVVELLNNFNGLVLIDEAYIDFSTKESFVNQLHKYPNLIVVQTLSKAYAAAAIRLGICYASEKIIRLISKIGLPYNTGLLSQKWAFEILRSHNQIKEQVKVLNREKKSLFKYLNKIAFVKTAYPSDANFILVHVDNSKKRYAELLEQGIVVRVPKVPKSLLNVMRITIGTPEENIKLKKALLNIENENSYE